MKMMMWKRRHIHNKDMAIWGSSYIICISLKENATDSEMFKYGLFGQEVKTLQETTALNPPGREVTIQL